MFPSHRYPTLVCEASSYTRSTQQHIHLLPSSSSAIDYCIQTLVLPLIAPRPDLLVALSACFPYNTSLIGTYLLQFAPSKPSYRLSSLDALPITLSHCNAAAIHPTPSRPLDSSEACCRALPFIYLELAQLVSPRRFCSNARVRAPASTAVSSQISPQTRPYPKAGHTIAR